MKKLLAASAAFGVLAPAALASSHYVKVSPTTVQPGHKVRVYGAVGTVCGTGSRVTIYSKAFKGATSHKWHGYPALYAKVDSQRKFSKTVTIHTIPTTNTNYRISARCGGASIGRAGLTVIGAY